MKAAGAAASKETCGLNAVHKYTDAEPMEKFPDLAV